MHASFDPRLVAFAMLANRIADVAEHAERIEQRAKLKHHRNFAAKREQRILGKMR